MWSWAQTLHCTGSNFWPITRVVWDRVCTNFWAKQPWARPGHHSIWCQVTGPQLHKCFVGRLDAEITKETSRGSGTCVVPVFYHSCQNLKHFSGVKMEPESLLIGTVERNKWWIKFLGAKLCLKPSGKWSEWASASPADGVEILWAPHMRAQGLGMDGISTKAHGLCPAVNCVFYLVAECTTWWVTLFFSFLFFFFLFP